MKSRRRPSKTCSCSTAAGLKALEGTPEGNLNLSALVSANPALTMLFGQPGALDTVDGLVVWRTLLIGGICAGFMGIYLVTRNVKAPEDNGQVELLASASVGSFSRLAAGLLVASLASIVLGLLTWPVALGLIVAIVVAASSYLMQERRVFGAGLLAKRSGPAHGFTRGTEEVPLAALVWRMNRSAVFGRLIMLVLMGALVGMNFVVMCTTVLSNPAFTQLLNFPGITLGAVELEFARLLLQVLALVSGLLGIRLANRFLEEE